MAKNRPTHVSRPVYPGGVAAMKKFVAEHLKYPPTAIAAKVEGTVVVRYGLNYTGKVTDTTVKKGIGHGCDEEACRVVALMRFTVPQSSKKKVRIHQDINIHFKLPKPKPKKKVAQNQQMTITYAATKSKIAGKVIQQKPQPGSGYTYTIEW